MNNNEKFLALYKDYETLVRNRTDKDPKDYEEVQGDLEMNRLRMCRQFRNYLSHQNDGRFLAVSDVQLKFMESVVDSLKKSGDTVKKHLKSPAAATVSVNEACKEALLKIASLTADRIVVVSKDGSYGIASVYDIIKESQKNPKAKMSGVKAKKSYEIVEPTVEYAQLPSIGTFVCEDNTKGDKKLLGVIYR